jgi:hypothetical protein
LIADLEAAVASYHEAIDDREAKKAQETAERRRLTQEVKRARRSLAQVRRFVVEYSQFLRAHDCHYWLDELEGSLPALREANRPIDHDRRRLECEIGRAVHRHNVRLFGRAQMCDVEIERFNPRGRRFHFADFVQLALVDIRRTLSEAHLSLEAKRARCLRALSDAGF